jgi:hypothetical protein
MMINSKIVENKTQLTSRYPEISLKINLDSDTINIAAKIEIIQCRDHQSLLMIATEVIKENSPRSRETKEEMVQESQVEMKDEIASILIVIAIKKDTEGIETITTAMKIGIITTSTKIAEEVEVLPEPKCKTVRTTIIGPSLGIVHFSRSVIKKNIIKACITIIIITKTSVQGTETFLCAKS